MAAGDDRGSVKFVLASAQCHRDMGDVGEGLKAVEEVVERLPDEVDVLLLPELFISGYMPGSHEAALQAGRECVKIGVLDRVQELARSKHLAIVLTLPELTEDGEKVYNASIAIDGDGKIAARYRKLHLWMGAESATFDGIAAAGASSVLPTFHLPSAVPGVCFGMCICYDVEFPETIRSLAERGAEVVLVPTASTGASRILSHILVPARAYENRVVVAYCNYPSHRSPTTTPPIVHSPPRSPVPEETAPHVPPPPTPSTTPHPWRLEGPVEAGHSEEEVGEVGESVHGSTWKFRDLGAPHKVFPTGFSGASVVYGADGSLLGAAAPAGREQVFLTTVPVRDASSAMHERRNPYLRDRRRDVWAWEAGGEEGKGGGEEGGEEKPHA